MPMQERNPENVDLLKADFVSWDHLRVFGPQLSIFDIVRGWGDDFLGQALHGQYGNITDAGGNITLMDGWHGGWVRLQTGAVIWRRTYLFLGDAADGYDTLDADLGYVQIARFSIDETTNIDARIGVIDVAENNIIMVGAATAGGPNWEIILVTGGGAAQHIQSAVAIDTDPHWHAMRVHPIAGPGRQVDYWLDGTLIATADTGTYTIPAIVLTPVLYVRTRAAPARTGYFDFWDIIPRNE